MSGENSLGLKPKTGKSSLCLNPKTVETNVGPDSKSRIKVGCKTFEKGDMESNDAEIPELEERIKKFKKTSKGPKSREFILKYFLLL